MRIAGVERFHVASRNCPTDAAVGAGGEAHYFRIRSEPHHPRNGSEAGSGREAARLARLAARIGYSLARILGDRDLSVGAKRALIEGALATRGAPLEALARAHDAVRFLRAQQFDRIDCFSEYGFGLVSVLSRLFGIPYHEFISHATRYFGEFAFELLAVVPYAYWLHRNGRLQLTQACRDTACLYYFSPRHEELPYQRSYVPVSEYPGVRRRSRRFDPLSFPTQIDTTQWIPPPYRSAFANEIFRWPKDLCIICNKYTPEPSVSGRSSRNFIGLEDLHKLLVVLRERFQVVYVRPREEDIVGDHQPIGEFGDLAMIRTRYRDVLTIQQIHRRHPKLSFNELQMKLFANCRHFVSVLGGFSYLSSYFGGKNIVLAKAGWEVSCNAYDNWFHLFSGTEVFRAATSGQLLQLVHREFAP